MRASESHKEKEIISEDISETESSDEKEKWFDSKRINKYWRNQQPKSINELDKEFIDEYFPPGMNSLMSYHPKSKNKEYLDVNYYKKFKKEFDEINRISKEVKWKRASNLIKNACIFENSIDISDIKQGRLGNCYFLSALSSFAQFPQLLKALFRTNKINKSGYYELIFYIDGEWQVVIIDDYIPIYKSKPLGAKPNGSEIWVLLLEKAYAKINGGYTNMIGGIPRDVFYLTGFRSKSYKINDLTIEVLADKLLRYNSSNCVMCCSTKSNKELVESCGLKISHAYSLIEAKEFHYSYDSDENYDDWSEDAKQSTLNISNSNFNEENGSKTGYSEGIEIENNSGKTNESIMLLQLRNPWGRVEPDLDWNDNSSLWTRQLKRFFGFPKESEKNKQKEDGLFFISIEDFYKYFNKLDVTYPSINLNVKTIDFKEYNLDCNYPQMFSIYVFKMSLVHIVIDFPNWRYNREKKIQTNPKSLFLAKFYPDNNNLVYMDNQFIISENALYLHSKLDEGFYVIYFFSGINQIGKREESGIKLTLKSSDFFYFSHMGTDESFDILFEILHKKIIQKNVVTLAKFNFFCCFKKFKKAGIKYYFINNHTSFYYDTVLDVSKMRENYSIVYPFYFENMIMNDDNFENIEENELFIKSQTEKDLNPLINSEEFEESFEKELKLKQKQNLKNKNSINNNFSKNIINNKNIKYYADETNFQIKGNPENYHDNTGLMTPLNYVICRTPPKTRIMLIFFTKNNLKNDNKIEIFKCKRLNSYNITKQEADEIYNSLLSEYNFFHEEYRVINGFDIDQINTIQIPADPKLLLKAFDSNCYTFIKKEFFIAAEHTKKRFLEFIKSRQVKNKNKQNNKKNHLLELVEDINPIFHDFENIDKKLNKNQKKIDEFKEKYPKLMEILEFIKPLENEDENKLKWKEIHIENHGKYIGTVNKYNIFHGRGIYIFEKLNNYSVSNFFMGKRNGACRIFNIKTNKLIFKGNYKNDMKEGYGVIQYDNKYNLLKYEGNFKYNKMNGIGKLFFSNGCIWEGNFIDNKMNGSGKLFTKDNQILKSHANMALFYEEIQIISS